MLLKREIGPKSWPLEAVMGVVWRRRGSGSLGWGCRFNSATRLTSISLQHEPRSWHDQATIGPQSGHDLASIVDLDLSQPPSSQVRMIPRRKEVQSWHDRAPIATRSGYDRTTIVVLRSVPSAVRWSFRWAYGHDRAIAWTQVSRNVRRPMEDDRDDDRDRDTVRSMRIGRTGRLHASPRLPVITAVRWWSMPPRFATCRPPVALHLMHAVSCI